MSTEDKGPDFLLDRAINEVREETIDPAAVEQAAGRVWARLSQEQVIRNCAEFQALIPAFLDGNLTAQRKLLFEDHVHECPVCRKALAGARSGKVVSMGAPARRAFWQSVPRWAVAATVLVTLGGAAFLSRDAWLPLPAGVPLTVQAVDGKVFRLASGSLAPAALGNTLGMREPLRTGADSRAVVKLRDGSLVEMAERTELSVSEKRSGITIQLASGNIIVQAAKQHSRHLYVATEDCLVSVTGTIFSVNHGMKGSRVSVVEGEVRVAQGKELTVLHPGDQFASGTALAPVPVKLEVAWSRHANSYAATLDQIAALRQKLEAIPAAGVRYSSRLLDLVPAGTVFYAAAPNLGSSLGEAGKILQEQAQQNESLKKWWDENGAKIAEALEKAQAYGGYLGPEIVVALVDRGGEHPEPLLLAEVARSGFHEFLEGDLKKFNAPIQVVDEAPQDGAAKGIVMLRGGFVAASSSAAVLRDVAGLMASPGTGAFAQSAFHARIAEAYQGGVSWLLCADLESLLKNAPKSNEGLSKSGFQNARYLVAQRREVNGKPQNAVALSFAGERQGIASWLAAPAASRALDFVSPDASAAMSAILKKPSLALEDIFRMTGLAPADFWKKTAEFEAHAGVSLQDDLIAPLGGELAVAMDGPLLPLPSWKVVLEVTDPARFEKALETMFQMAKMHAGDAVQFQKEQVGQTTYYTAKGAKPGMEVHYTYADGFLVAAPSRALVDRALEYRRSGYNLPHATVFTSLLPRDGHTGFSAAGYYNLSSVAGTLKDMGELTGQKDAAPLRALLANAEPSLVVAYGEPDRIELAGTGALFGMSPEQLLSLQVLQGMVKK